MLESLTHFKDYLRFSALPGQDRKFVFYSQSEDDWVHLGPVVKALIELTPGNLCYVSSTGGDPGRNFQHARLLTFTIGSGLLRTQFLNSLEARILVMSMPDLGTYQIKRSAGTRHYAYIHHSLVSTHMAYRPGAFDQFDSIFCSGPHHWEETRMYEAAHHLEAKQLHQHGYGRLDDLLALTPTKGDGRTLLVAPSWGPQGLLENHASHLLDILTGAGFQVIVRPHPQTCRYAPSVIAGIGKRAAGDPRVTLEQGVADAASLVQADLMISDWSGVAFEFALGMLKPVIFVEVPRKVNDSAYVDLAREPLEVSARTRLGTIVDLANLEDLPGIITEALGRKDAARHSLAALREEMVYNLGRSAVAGAKCLMGIDAGLGL